MAGRWRGKRASVAQARRRAGAGPGCPSVGVATAMAAGALRAPDEGPGTGEGEAGSQPFQALPPDLARGREPRPRRSTLGDGLGLVMRSLLRRRSRRRRQVAAEADGVAVALERA